MVPGGGGGRRSGPAGCGLAAAVRSGRAGHAGGALTVKGGRHGRADRPARRSDAAGPVTLVALLPSKADDTDELTAWRSGGTEARTTPTANTAQARAMAGLIRPARQPCCGPRRA